MNDRGTKNNGGQVFSLKQSLYINLSMACAEKAVGEGVRKVTAVKDSENGH